MSEDKLRDQIENAIQKAAIDGSLTKEAVKVVSELFNNIDTMKKDAERDAKRIADLTAERDRLNEQNHKYAEIQNGVKEREEACAAKEQEHRDRQVKLECAELRVSDHQNMFGLVFRNAVLRNSTLGQELVAIPGTPDQVDQYGNRQYGTGREPDVTGVPVSKTEEKTET
jgi:hypothetical protein